jgi:N,N'-diacetylbacillosaminyl-diphospho-undecaprenol alpha-1,3-N-acetylgalactosaminyltransferase
MKVLMIVNTDGALYVFRKPIIIKLISLGHEVVTISSESRYFPFLRELGVRPIALEFDRHSISPVKNLKLLFQLSSLIKQHRPDIVHSFTHKAAIYGTLGAWLAGISKIFVTVTGLGTLFVRDGATAGVMRWLLLAQYKIALRFATAVFFQNPDDMRLFLSGGIVTARKAILTHGSGLDLREFTSPAADEVARAKAGLSRELGIEVARRKIVLFPARGVVEKGFSEFYEAAKIIGRVSPDGYLFIHLGLVDVASSGRISKAGMESFARECGVHYLGHRDNIRDYMTAAQIVALPSYREGMPRSLLEALALGKVVITTDAPGCRETVIDGWNGYLCSVGDARSLAEKILAVSDEFIDAATARSRRLCEMKYDASRLVDLTLNCYFGQHADYQDAM